MVKIDAFQALDQGSIPCYGNIIIKCSLQHKDIDINIKDTEKLLVAQLAERRIVVVIIFLRSLVRIKVGRN